MCWCTPEKRTPWCENSKDMPRPKPPLARPVLIDIRPVAAERVSFFCPKTKFEAFDLLLERGDQRSFLVQCSRCRGTHVVEIGN